jgi:hypothetical protein
MSEMVERVAKAIQEKCHERGYKGCPEPLITHVAAAAIEAMREPTEHMIVEGKRLEDRPRKVWQAMIDEALR